MTSLSNRKLHIDFETQSECDLSKVGVAVYARHPSTIIHCMGYSFDDEEVNIWIPPQPFPEEVKEHVAKGGIVVAHNSFFEINIWNLCLCRKYL